MKDRIAIGLTSLLVSGLEQFKPYTILSRAFER